MWTVKLNHEIMTNEIIASRNRTTTGAGLSPVLHRMFLFVVGLGTALALGTAVQAARNLYRKVQRRQVRATFEEALRLANYYGDTRNYPLGRAYLRWALDNAPSMSARLQACEAMGTFLMEWGEFEPFPHLLSSYQYLTTTISTNRWAYRNPEEIRRVYKKLVRVCTMLGRREEEVRFINKAMDLTEDPNTKIDLYKNLHDIGLKSGTWAEQNRLARKLETYIEEIKKLSKDELAEFDPGDWDQVIKRRKALTAEKVLLDDAWFAEYVRSEPEVHSDVLRHVLLEETLQSFRELTEYDQAWLHDDSQFRVARLLYHAERFAEANEAVQDFLENEPDIHLSDTLLILIGLARWRGDAMKAQDLIHHFINRFKVDRQAADEMHRIVKRLEEEGLHESALKLVEDYLQVPWRDIDKPQFLVKAADLAKTLKDYDKARHYFNEFVELKPNDAELIKAILGQVDIAMEQEAYDEADKLLSKYLAHSLYKKGRKQAIYKLFDVKRKNKAPLVDVMLTGLAAAEAFPEHERTADTLLRMAMALEQVGLYAYAENHYNRMALLQMVSDSTNLISEAIGKATLGMVRCLMHNGDLVRADHLLRELCNNYASGPIRSEAAFHWSTVAFYVDQNREAMRRLDTLVDTNAVSTNMLLKIQMQRRLVQAGMKQLGAEINKQNLADLRHFTDPEDAAFVRQMANAHLVLWKRQRDLAAAEAWLKGIATLPLAEKLPLHTYFYDLAGLVLKQSGSVDTLREFLDRNALWFQERTGDELDLLSTIETVRANTPRI